jgi:hypothetical protein
MKPETPAKPKGLPGDQVAKASELVNYQDGAVVSREIVKRPTGSVTLFAFDEGQGLSEHTAPFDALAPWNSHRNCGSSRSVYSTGRVQRCSKARRKSASLASRIACRAAR